MYPEVGTKTIRPPAPIDVIRSVQRTCPKMEDNNRPLIALISVSGILDVLVAQAARRGGYATASITFEVRRV